jgi:acyl-CoA synthetase (NDP forming)
MAELVEDLRLRARQDELVAKTRGYGLRMLGPNCMGLLNLDPQVCLHASFSPVAPRPGHIAFSSQSGALGSVAMPVGYPLEEFRPLVIVSTTVPFGSRSAWMRCCGRT